MSAAENMRRRIERVPTGLDVANRAAELFVRRNHEAQPSGRFTVALSGGSTPRAFHALLAAPPYRDQVDWSIAQFYWGDERYVAPDDPESNFRMARETLLDKIPIHEAQIHRVHTEMDDPAAAAGLYESEIRQEFALAGGALPRFDLIFLGMGPDGHTASLFPHTAALGVRDRLVVANYVPKLSTWRITLTEPVLNAAATMAFLVAGADKADALSAVLDGPRDPEQYPSQLVAPTAGEALWIVDDAAAARLRAR
ncbi:MAG TPA: 6-phosphogluconolactonase [Ktedonobacterales bacterium]|nr:6-phosphogluconolactonase [Ktedonobacterales bacterium]